MNWSLNLRYITDKLIKPKKMSNLNQLVPITGWEKWINRIVTVALAAWQAIQYLLTHWASNPPQI